VWPGNENLPKLQVLITTKYCLTNMIFCLVWMLYNQIQYQEANLVVFTKTIKSQSMLTYTSPFKLNWSVHFWDSACSSWCWIQCFLIFSIMMSKSYTAIKALQYSCLLWKVVTSAWKITIQMHVTNILTISHKLWEHHCLGNRQFINWVLGFGLIPWQVFCSILSIFQLH